MYLVMSSDVGYVLIAINVGEILWEPACNSTLLGLTLPFRRFIIQDICSTVSPHVSISLKNFETNVEL